MLPCPVSFIISLTLTTWSRGEVLPVRRHLRLKSGAPVHTHSRGSAQGFSRSSQTSDEKSGRIHKGLRHKTCNKTKIWIQIYSVPNISPCMQDLQSDHGTPNVLSAVRLNQKHWLSFKIEAPTCGHNFCLLWLVSFVFLGGRWCCSDLKGFEMLSLCHWHCYSSKG